jgi:tripartite-type tricarboxylate transporter receptor subunit TctC
MTGTRPLWLSALLAFLLTDVVGNAHALDYPKQIIKVVVPFAAAGVTDVVARVVFDRVGRTTGQTIVIDNVLAPVAPSRSSRS